MRKLFFVALFALSFVFSHAQAQATGPFGNWLDESGKTKVQLFNCNGRICGKIVWLRKPLKDGKPKTDIKNKNPNLRKRPVIGMQIINGLKPRKGGKWKGKIYNPDDGGTYKASMKLVNANTAKLKGCWLFICKTRIWKRVK